MGFSVTNPMLSGWELTIDVIRPHPGMHVLCPVCEGPIPLCRQGSGRRADPFRYWLADKEKTWRQDPVHELMERLGQESALLRQGLPRLG
jgi:hypothetical protein